MCVCTQNLHQACNCIYPKRNDFNGSHAIRSNNQHIPPINVKNNIRFTRYNNNLCFP